MLEVRGLVVRYGSTVAVDGVDLTVGDGAVAGILGPSGCGKTTLLRAIAGLEHPDAGAVLWDGTDLVAVPPHRRGFGLMFQEHALFPHRDVAGNVAFGLRMQGMVAGERDARVHEVLELVGLTGFERRSVTTLSGGERQRVALARALAPRPRLLLLDEPLGSLDRALRDRLAVDIRDLLTTLGVTAIHVTHDQDEAFAVADLLVVMRSGRVIQSGPPEEVWARPADEDIARFLGFENVRDGVVVRSDAFAPAPDGDVRGVVRSRTYRGDHFVVRVERDDGSELVVHARWTPPPKVGDRVALRLDPDGIVPLGDSDVGRS